MKSYKNLKLMESKRHKFGFILDFTLFVVFRKSETFHVHINQLAEVKIVEYHCEPTDVSFRFISGTAISS